MSRRQSLPPDMLYEVSKHLGAKNAMRLATAAGNRLLVARAAASPGEARARVDRAIAKDAQALATYVTKVARRRAMQHPVLPPHERLPNGSQATFFFENDRNFRGSLAPASGDFMFSYTGTRTPAGALKLDQVEFIRLKALRPRSSGRTIGAGGLYYKAVIQRAFQNLAP